MGAAIANVSSAGGIARYIATKCKEKLNGKTFADWIRSTKDQGRPTISTAVDKGCGGYDSGNIFKIEYRGLKPYPLDSKIMPDDFGDIKWTSDGLVAYMNGERLQTSTIIVIDLKLETGEWAFFTKAPPEQITEYKAGDGKSFVTSPRI